ncbi:hypothetical protein EFK50_14465 [Nocardioides marmoriginsengisoli]|uniref:ATP-grasp domain-containing protein n=1 Tax=Nocardioides marmoriginsengisoli TaxID=661483 RepID=A0A3N0CIT7_9ACTN|nr:hypothetical protein [Nocardioides marmoriginsengisoli]RNL62926.1 hypothetical protein EFK50_14465 [Nocardioides marmoriginsengisoli]
MITYYATTPHCYTFESFVRDWAPELADQVRVLGYSELDLAAAPAPGLHVLTDFERLLGPEQRFARRLHGRLRKRAGLRVLGDPGRWLGRHALLRRLHEEGINDFRAYTVDELGPQVRFPVFLRWANAHEGSMSKPIHDLATLEKRLAKVARENRRRWRWIRDQLLVVELVDAVSDDGVFRKYSIARIGDEYIPRHLVVDRDWVTKGPVVVTPEIVAEEEAFLASPADLDLVKQVFEIAGIEFGRIDWGYAGGRAQFWEINTNPMLAPHNAPDPLRRPSQERQTALTREALESQAAAAGGGSRAGVVPAPERWAWQALNAGSRRWDPRRR